MSRAFKGKMAQEITDWENTGLIGRDLSELLHQRYDPRPFSGALFLKWLGLFAIFMLALSFLGVVGTILASVSPVFSALCLMAVSGGVLYFGARLASDKQQKHPVTGQALLTIGLVGFYSSMTTIYLINSDRPYADVHAWLLLIGSAAALVTAYHFRLRWPLLIGLLMFFHGVGSSSGYWGHGSYFFHIHDERLMAVVALLVAILGVWHESRLEVTRFKHCIGFGHMYIIFGLLYLNLSFWLLSLEAYESASVLWVLIFTASSVAQIVAGARLKDARFTGFGIVFLSINLYTRLFEHFWDDMSKALFFILAGAVALTLAYLFERQLKPVTNT
ncbi:hypothetical protein DES49_0543 [Halospina denitrificans]|uniref:Membrane protein DUF2157 n=1 Tax=Halospina denitrificans TaxID=332522 RepID=A0A4R7K473_9GAMM|nr:DUF2157 domain-containing protein [Halospina denitrificans]TDT44439.1 hypothetical protein DES49_0543 [Halospina denitrificans]